VSGIGVEDLTGSEPDGDQAFLCENETRGRAAGSVIVEGDQRHAEVKRAVAVGEAAGSLDFADRGFGGNGQAGGSLHAGDFVLSGVQEVDPDGMLQGLDRQVGEALRALAGAGEGNDHDGSLPRNKVVHH
jgi:hypothetical protein